MSVKVIDLNDSAVSVSDESGILVTSPGFALVGDKGLVVGSVAEQQARLRPTNSFNKFWSQLSMEPLNYAAGNVRHHADLAYAHLLHLAEEAGLDGDVIFAVPGNFSSQQLSVLLGLAGKCPFTPTGIVDSALVNAIKLADSPSLVFADIQLHQALLTRFSAVDGQLRREAVVQIPDAGMHHYTNLLMQLATGLFIQQCRFNPQHNAESEQQLYNSLPKWLDQYGEHQNSLPMEIKTASTVHEAKLPNDTLRQRLNEFYSRITQQLGTLIDGDETRIAISSGLADLPFFRQSLAKFGEVKVARPENFGMTCIRLREHIDTAEGGFQFVTQLPLSQEASTAARTVNRPEAVADDNPTHLLYGSVALPLGKIMINNEAQATTGRVNGKAIHLPVAGLPLYLGQIEKEGSEVYLVCGEAGALVNGEKISGRRRLELGDQVRFSPDSDSVSLIRVRSSIG